MYKWKFTGSPIAFCSLLQINQFKSSISGWHVVIRLCFALGPSTGPSKYTVYKVHGRSGWNYVQIAHLYILCIIIVHYCVLLTVHLIGLKANGERTRNKSWNFVERMSKIHSSFRRCRMRACCARKALALSWAKWCLQRNIHNGGINNRLFNRLL